MESEKVKIAREYATRMHKGQKRRDGKPYITHPEAVANMFFENEEDEKIVAWLHDVLEDCDVDEREFRKFCIDNFGCTVYLSIASITKNKGLSYIDYIKGVNAFPLAKKVKLADLRHNLNNLERGNMKDKYILAKFMLESNILNTVRR